MAAFTLEAAAADAKFETLPEEGPGFNRAWRVATLKDTSPMDAIELKALNARPVKRGDVAMIRFFGRATVASDETGMVNSTRGAKERRRLQQQLRRGLHFRQGVGRKC